MPSLWDGNLNIYLAGICSRPYCIKEHNTNIHLALGQGGTSACYKDYDTLSGKNMNLHLVAANSGMKQIIENQEYDSRIFILESFFYVQDWMDDYIKNHWNFLLDSGAFTFMVKNKNNIDWNEYLERYAVYINRLDIKYFFELDIDSIVGYNEVLKLRKKLESLTNKKCIPVWHRARGKDAWLSMIKEYKYVTIGGIVTKEIGLKNYGIFTWLLNEAKKKNCKVHGLGFTNLNGMRKYKFYSVDSTAWIYGNRGGFLYKFCGDNLVKINTPPGKRLKPKEAAIHNFNEWVKFQKYAKECL